MTLLVVLDPCDPDARAAAGVFLSRLGPGRRHPSGKPLPVLRGVSVAFVGAPPARVLAAALAEARTVAVVATHAPDVCPAGVLWASGPTLEQAARWSTGQRREA